VAEPKPERADALAKQLKDSLVQRRPRNWKPVLALIVVCSLILVGLAWWLYPRAPQAPLEIVALDGIFTADESPSAVAQLVAPEEEEGKRSLAGQKIVFYEQLVVAAPDRKPREVSVQSDQQGQATAEWPTRAPRSEILVRCLSTGPKPANIIDSGTVFVWPSDAALLIVDADETLIGDHLDAQAAATLQKAAAADWRIVYLTPGPADARAWRSARGWLRRHEELPVGPVLGRREFPSDTPTPAARRALLQSLDKFIGPKRAVVKTPASANLCRELGLDTVLLGAAAAPAGVTHAATWDDVPVELKKR
jgi:hypothetical protein